MGRCPTGIEKLSNGILVHLHHVAPINLSARQQFFVVSLHHPRRFRLAIQQHEISHLRNRVSKGLNQRKELAFEEENLRFGIVENISKLLRCKADIQRQQNRPSLKHPVVRFQQSMAIRTEERHPVPRLDSHSPQASSQAPRSLGKFRVGESLVVAHHGRIPGKLFFRIPQAPKRRKWDVHFSVRSRISACPFG